LIILNWLCDIVCRRKINNGFLCIIVLAYLIHVVVIIYGTRFGSSNHRDQKL